MNKSRARMNGVHVEEKKVMEKQCPYCSRIFTSVSKNQLEQNYYSHVGACRNKKRLKGGKTK